MNQRYSLSGISIYSKSDRLASLLVQPGQVGTALKTPRRETVGSYSRLLGTYSVVNSLTSTGSFSVDLGNGKRSPSAMLLLFEPEESWSLKRMVLDLEKGNWFCVHFFFSQMCSWSWKVTYRI